MKVDEWSLSINFSIKILTFTDFFEILKCYVHYILNYRYLQVQDVKMKGKVVKRRRAIPWSSCSGSWDKMSFPCLRAWSVQTNCQQNNQVGWNASISLAESAKFRTRQIKLYSISSTLINSYKIFMILFCCALY